MDAITVSAPGKLNLALAVAPPEPPGSPRAGWHRIASWFHAIGLAGEVRAERAQTTTHSIDWAPDAPAPSPIDWPVTADLTHRALLALEARVGRTLPTRLTIAKRVPVGGGLGGGSSEAASTLLALNALHALDLDHAELARIGAMLGSDVPYFLDEARAPCAPDDAPRPALVTGFGDEIERTPRVGADAVLIVPSFGCPTPAVYRAFDADPPASFAGSAVALAARGADLAAPLPPNDLAAPACLVEPRLGELLRRAHEVEPRVRVTGSGSVCFVLAAEGQGELLAGRWRGVCAPDASVLVTRLIAPQT